jgi:hypothetical protein
LFDNLTEDRIPNDLEMFSSPDTNSCISGRNFVNDKPDTLPPGSLAAAEMISVFVDFLAVCIFFC